MTSPIFFARRGKDLSPGGSCGRACVSQVGFSLLIFVLKLVKAEFYVKL